MSNEVKRNLGKAYKKVHSKKHMLMSQNHQLQLKTANRDYHSPIYQTALTTLPKLLEIPSPATSTNH